MAPILIDSRDLIKLGFISVLTAAFVFASGVFFGHQQATAFYLPGSEPAPLALPEKITAIDSDIEPQLPEIIDAGEEIDVDQPLVESKKTSHLLAEKKITSAFSNTTKVDSSPSSGAITSEEHQVKDVAHDNIQPVNLDTTKTEKNTDKADTDTGFIQQDRPVLVSSLTSDELDKIKYSIQVGMYSRLQNAELMMEQLQLQRLNAYVSEFTNKKDESRYNVRFGYFVNKGAALSALATYKSDRKGDGYLVRFSVDNISELARVADTEKPVIIEKASESLLPTTKPSDTIRQEELPVNTVSTIDIMMETQTGALAESQIKTLSN